MATSQNDAAVQMLVNTYAASALATLRDEALGCLDEGAQAYGLVYLGRSQWKLQESPTVRGSERLDFIASGPELDRAKVVEAHVARIAVAHAEHAELMKTLVLIAAADEGGPAMEKLMGQARTAKAQRVDVEARLRAAQEALQKAEQVQRRHVDRTAAQAVRTAEAELEAAEAEEETALSAAKSARLLSKKKAWARHEKAQARAKAARVAHAEAAEAASRSAGAEAFNEGISQQIVRAKAWVSQLGQKLQQIDLLQRQVTTQQKKLRDQVQKKLASQQRRVQVAPARKRAGALLKSPTSPQKKDDGPEFG